MAANNAQVCEEHDKCEYNYYCKDCKKNICLVCKIPGHGAHSGHNYCTITQATTEFTDGVKETSDKIDEMIKGLDEGKVKIEKIKAKIQEQGDDVKKKIDNHYNELEQKLNKQREEMKQQVTEAVKRKGNTLTTQLSTVEQAKSEVQNMKGMKDALEEKFSQEALSNSAAQQKQVIDDCLQ